MQVQTPNLFSFATSELSQDAFICWLASWAQPELKAIDPLLHKTAQEFVASLIRKCKIEIPEIESIDIQRQNDRIDILVFVNKATENRLAILIEDKTHTNHHSSQLERYYSLVSGDKYAFRDDQIIPIYFKTGYQSRFDLDSTYHLYLRKDFLEILRTGKNNGIDNAIYNDFLDHLENMESVIKLYQTKSLDEKWLATDWIGFYMGLFDEFGHQQGTNWNYIPNQTGGFYGFWWGFIESDLRYVPYLQLEQQKLCIKIQVSEKSERAIIREKAYKRLIEKTNQTQLKFVRPRKMGNGNFMTVLELSLDGYRVFRNGVIDMEQTIEVLKSATQLLIDAFQEPYSTNQPVTHSD